MEDTASRPPRQSGNGLSYRIVTGSGEFAPTEACLYAALDCAREDHDRLLRELVAPLVREIQQHSDLDSLFFIRYDDPRWQLRLRILGRPVWIEGPVRAAVEQALRPFVVSGAIVGVEFGAYVREWDRYGGPVGMRLAERIFHHDSVACLARLEAEARGELQKSRREYSLLFTEGLLDLFGLDDGRRLQFYRMGHDWAFRDGVFRPDDVARLERQYDTVRHGLHGLLEGSENGGIASTCLAELRGLADELHLEHARGNIHQELLPLLWSYAHLHCNRLGIELVPEAILRYLMFRFYDERSSCSPPSS